MEAKPTVKMKWNAYVAARDARDDAYSAALAAQKKARETNWLSESVIAEAEKWSLYRATELACSEALAAYETVRRLPETK